MLRFFRHAEKPSAELLMTPIERCSFVVIDTELTGLDPKRDSIVSIGGIKMTGGSIEMGNTFYEIASPESAMTSQSILIHGITPGEVSEKRLIGRVLEDFQEFCKGSVIVGHFLSLDLFFINKELKKLFNRTLQGPAVDTYRIYDWLKQHNGDFSRHFSAEDDDKNLFNIAAKFKIQVSNAHNSLADAFITAQLFQRFLSVLPNLGVKTMKELLRISKP